MAEIKTFKKNEVIFKAGESGEFMYDILSGSVGIYSDYGLPEQKLLAKIEGSGFVGEMGMIEKKPRSATAVALENTEAAIVTSENFDEYLKEEPKKAIEILKHTSARLRQLSHDYIVACATAAEYIRVDEMGLKQSPDLMKRIKAITSKK